MLWMGDYANALQAYNQSLTLNDGFAPAYLGRARVHITENPGNWQSAQDDLLHAVQLDPNMGEAFLELTAIEIPHGTTVKAQQYLNSATSLMPGSPLVTYYQSELDFFNGYSSKAYTEGIQSQSQDITYLPTYRLLGEILQSQGRLVESLVPLQTYLMYANQDLPAWVMVGKAYAATGDLDNALRAYDLAIQNGLQNYDLWLARADLYIAKGDGQSAYNDYSKALASDPTSFKATLGIGNAYLALKQYGNAYNQISRAEGMVSTPEEKAMIYYYRAQSLEGLMSRNEAKDYMVIKEWKSLLALPANDMPQSWRDTATQHIALLQTPTPTKSPSRTITPPPATATPTSIKSPSPSPTQAKSTSSHTP